MNTSFRPIGGIFQSSFEPMLSIQFPGCMKPKYTPNALYPVMGAGFIPALVGIALIINDKINYDRYFNKELDKL